MKEASETLEFEKAIEYRELLKQRPGRWPRSRRSPSSDGEDRDVLALAKDEQDAVVQVFFVRDGRAHRPGSFPSEPCRRVRAGAQILEQLYQAVLRRNAVYPQGTHAAVRSGGCGGHGRVADRDAGGRRYICGCPKRAPRKNWWSWRPENAEMVLSQDKERIQPGGGPDHRSHEGDRGLAGTCRNATRMEAFDISNTNGFESVGSMVVYEKGQA